MKKLFYILFCTFIFFSTEFLQAQCAVSKIEVSITVRTDGYGYEAYWQLIPAANNCGAGTIFAGGNTSVGCNGGGNQAQSPGGYGDFQTITEGPWCLDEGVDYSIFLVDDYADGGTQFDVSIAGFPVYTFKGTSTDERFTFTVEAPPAVDAAMIQISTSEYISFGEINIDGILKNTGTTNITSLDLSYTIDGGTSLTETLSGLNIAPFTEYYFTHSMPWTPSTSGAVSLLVAVSNVNGQGQDGEATNDAFTKNITVKEPIPNIMHWYTEPDNNMTFETIATGTDEVRTPRDLDFQPSGELWIVNKETEQNGGTTVTFFNPGAPNQTSEFLQDGNAWHFMSLPTALAFSNNGNFATANGVFDANHDGNTPFTGPALWSSDLAVYAQPSGGNGSHLDMLHESPQGMGIASESENKFWLFDSYNRDIVFYDFQADHGPGNEDHSDGIIHRYKGMTVDRINEHIPCHLAYDLNSGWLYIVDGGNQRILRLDTKSGTPGGTPTFGPFEPLEEYTDVTGATWETVVDSGSGLQQPTGIDILGDRMIVSDYFTGDIIIYDISAIPAEELTRISTGSSGVMGLVVGPDGRIWYVNADNNTVMRIEPDSVPEQPAAVFTVKNDLALTLYPVPADDEINIVCNDCRSEQYQLTLMNMLGEEIFTQAFSSTTLRIDTRSFPAGVYTAMVKGKEGSAARKIVVR